MFLYYGLVAGAIPLEQCHISAAIKNNILIQSYLMKGSETEVD